MLSLIDISICRYWLDLTEKDIIWSNNDTGWAKTAYSNTFGPWSMGAAVFTHHTPKFDPSLTLKVRVGFCVGTCYITTDLFLCMYLLYSY